MSASPVREPASDPQEQPLLSIEGLRTYFYDAARSRFIRSVDGVELQVYPGETLVIVGESGSGKSVSMLSVLGLVSGTPGVVGGRIWYRPPGAEHALDLLDGLERYVRVSTGRGTCIEKHDLGWRRVSERRLRPLRGTDLSMIFQNPRSALHPYFTIGDQLVEAIRRRTPELTVRQARERAAEWLDRVRIDAPIKRLYDYPHGLSGGMCQRVMIAMALAASPVLLIADEPTTGLDATVQSCVLDLLTEMKESLGTTTIVVTHDMSVAHRLADRVVVMYGGRVLEAGPAELVLDPEREPKHPYTRGLLHAVPSDDEIRSRRWLRVIQGDVPDPSRLASGCVFAARCEMRPEVDPERCEDQAPVSEALSPRHEVRCWRYTKRVDGKGEDSR